MRVIAFPSFFVCMKPEAVARLSVMITESCLKLIGLHNHSRSSF